MRYLLIFLLAGNASAAGISLCNLCEGYTISKRADGAVVLRCPGKPDPLLILKSCRNPAVQRSGATATITCR